MWRNKMPDELHNRDLVEALDPIYCHVTGAFNVRGGISITVDAEYEKP